MPVSCTPSFAQSRTSLLSLLLHPTGPHCVLKSCALFLSLSDPPYRDHPPPTDRHKVLSNVVALAANTSSLILQPSVWEHNKIQKDMVTTNLESLRNAIDVKRKNLEAIVMVMRRKIGDIETKRAEFKSSEEAKA